MMNRAPMSSPPAQAAECDIPQLINLPPPRKISMSLSVHNNFQLEKSGNAWKPGMKRESLPADPELRITQDLFKKVISILNKLTPEKFPQLMKQMWDLNIDTEERLKGVVDLVFEKAIDEPSFSVIYGNMCGCLVELKVPTTNEPNNTVTFRELLLSRCQNQFEKVQVDDVVFETKPKELDSAASTDRDCLKVELQEAEVIARRRSTGNIKLIGELFKVKMLNETTIHDCVVKLLTSYDELTLECLCLLLKTIGKDLDFDEAKPEMDQYFNDMERIVKARQTSSRIRFMLQDTVDLRLKNWVPRRADQGPKTIKQIHTDAMIEEQEEQRNVQQLLLCKDPKRQPDPNEQSDQHAQGEETWNTYDPSKMPKFSKPQMDENTYLGPPAQVTWVKGCSGGAKAIDSELSRTVGLNRISALQSTPSPPPSTTPQQNPDSDTRRTLERGSSSEELLESPTLEKPRRDREQEGAVPRRPCVIQDQPEPEPELRLVPEPVKLEPNVQMTEIAARSVEEIERKVMSIINEFLLNKDFQEAVECVEDLDLGSQLHIFIRVGVDLTLDRTQITQDHMGQLLLQLVQKGIMPKPQFYKGFLDILEKADSMVLDVPYIFLYLAELLSPVLREGGFSMRELFSELSKPLLPVGKAEILISEILLKLCKQMGIPTVASLWREAGLNWTDFLPKEEDVQAFLRQKKLQFLQPLRPSVTQGPPEPELSIVQ